MAIDADILLLEYLDPVPARKTSFGEAAICSIRIVEQASRYRERRRLVESRSVTSSMHSSRLSTGAPTVYPCPVRATAYLTIRYSSRG
jgi:hypothetical protein